MKHAAAAVLPFAAALLWAAPAMAQSTPAGPSAEKIKQVIVYGDDPCPESTGDEIVVCARQDEAERYRIPENLRGEARDVTNNEPWTNKVRSIEYVGKSGTESCSPVGAGGFTGCFAQIAAQAKAERKGMGDASWADLVAAERAKRLSTIDEDSKEIEARVKAEEAARAQAEAQPAQNEAVTEGTEEK